LRSLEVEGDPIEVVISRERHIPLDDPYEPFAHERLRLLASSALSLKVQLLDRLPRGPMPVEVFDVEEFVKLSERAKHCAVKRSRDVVKLKLRAGRYLYTLKVDPDRADEIIKQLKCEVREIE